MALESTGAAEDTLLIGATMQPAEPAARPVLNIAHWLTDGSALTRRLLERFRFAFVPLPNPDGTTGGALVHQRRRRGPHVQLRTPAGG